MEIVSMMTRDEAIETVAKIKEGVVSVGQLLLNLYERGGWKALGYPSWQECAVTEFDFGRSYAYRLLEAARTERVIGTSLPEYHARILATINLNDNELKEFAHMYDEGFNVTGNKVRQLAQNIYVKRIPELFERVNNGELGVSKAYSVALAVEQAPDDRKHIVSKCSDPALANAIAQAQDSDLLDEITLAEGIPSFDDYIPLEEATLQSLVAWENVASAEHRAAYVERNRELYDALNACHNRILALVLKMFADGLSTLEMDELRNVAVQASEMKKR